MKGFNYPIFYLTLCLILGITAQQWLAFSVLKTGVFTVILAFLAFILHFLFRKRKNFWLSIPLYSCFVSLGMLATAANNPLQDTHHFSVYEQHNVPLYITITEVLKPNAYSSRYLAEVNRINGKKSTGKILLNIPRDSAKGKTHFYDGLHVDELYALKNTIARVRPPRNPYQFDYAAYLADLGVYGQVYTAGEGLLLINGNVKSARGAAARFRSFLQGRLASTSFKPREWGVINALLLGQRQQLTARTRQNYIDAGVVHILAISGLHVGIVLFLLRMLFKPLGNARSMRLLRSLLVILGIWTFALIAGLSPSVLRAATMFSFLQVGLASNRKSGGMNGLVASALVLLLIDPKLLFQVGFQLSYAAVFSILWLQPSLYGLWGPKNRILRYFWGIFTVTLTAQLGVLPLSLFYFHQFSGLFFLSNLVVIPLLGVILGAGIFMLFLAVFGAIPSFFAQAYAAIVSALNDFIFWVAGFDTLIIAAIYSSLTWLLPSYLFIITGARLFKKFNYARVIAVLGTVVLLIAFHIYEENFSGERHFYILHKNRGSLLVRQNMQQVQLYHNAGSALKTRQLFDENTIAEIKSAPLRNYYEANGRELLIIDSLGVYNIRGADPDYILLRQSPKVNLERLLARFPKTTIIADGSNYRTYVNRWKITCLQQKTPFHSTYEKGAFELE